MELILCIVAALILFELLPVFFMVGLWILALVFLRANSLYISIFGRGKPCR